MIGVITTVCGTGELGFPDQMNTPNALAVGADGNLYIADFNNHRICCWERRTGTLRTVAGHPTEWRQGLRRGLGTGDGGDVELAHGSGVGLERKLLHRRLGQRPLS